MKLRWRKTNDGYAAERDGNYLSLMRDPVRGLWRYRVATPKGTMESQQHWSTSEEAMRAAEAVAQNMYYESLVRQEEKRYIQVIRCPDGWQVIDVERETGRVVPLGKPFSTRHSAREGIDHLAHEAWLDQHLRGEVW